MSKIVDILSVISSIASLAGSAAYAANMAGDSLASINAAKVQEKLGVLESTIRSKTTPLNEAITKLQSYVNQMNNVRAYIDPRMIGKLDRSIGKVNELIGSYSNKISELSSKVSQAQQETAPTSSGIGYLFNEITGKNKGTAPIDKMISEIEQTAVPTTTTNNSIGGNK